MTKSHWDREVDLLIIGAGAAGMAAALVAKAGGLEVLVCEKTGLVGGTTATAGGTAWVPNNSLSRKTTHPDNIDAARRYLDGEIGPEDSPLREAFLKSGPEAVDWFARNTEVKFKANDPYPDYHAEQPGGAAGARALSPVPFDGGLLGRDFAKLRPPIPELMIFGGMMVSRDEIKYLIRPWRSLHAFRLATWRLLEYLLARIEHRRGTRLVLGNALVGRLFYSCRQKDIEIALDAKLVEVIRNGDRVEGALVDIEGVPRRIRARAGVMLATGGCAANPEWRRKLTGQEIAYTTALDGASGDGLDAGIASGGVVENGRAGAFWWMPASRVCWPDGRVGIYPHIRDRPKPGLIAVNKAGRRFVNEADSYHDFVKAMFRANETVPSIPAWLICDRMFLRNYGLGAIHPVWQNVSFFEKIGYVTSAPTLAELAAKIGVDASGLAEEVARHNRAASTGVDEAFGKGSKALNRHNGDPEHDGPNPCLKAIEHGPFYAMAVYPAPLGASAGLRTNSDCQLLDAAGAVIPGLYACGNDMCSVMQGNYPGPGSTLGPAITFAYRAALHAVDAQRRTQQERAAAVATV